MFIDIKSLRIFLKPDSTDMRKQINGLSIITQEVIEQDPFSGNLFMFCNKSRTILKILYWDRNGFAMWLKRLEKGKYPWPRDNQKIRELSEAQLRMLLDGIDFWNAYENLNYKKVI
jgi:transposase